MHPSQFITPAYSAQVPMIMTAILCLLTSYLFFIKSRFQISVRGFAWASATLEFFSSVILYFFSPALFSSIILYGLSRSLAYLAIWHIFCLLVKAERNMLVRCLLYFGWTWAFVNASLGVIIAFTLKENNYPKFSSEKYNPLFLYELCNWGFILTVCAAILISNKKCSSNCKIMLAYAILNTISATFFTVYNYSPAAQKLSEYAGYFLGNATEYIATAIATLFFLDWVEDKTDDIELGDTRPANMECDNDSQITLTEDLTERRHYRA